MGKTKSFLAVVALLSFVSISGIALAKDNTEKSCLRENEKERNTCVRVCQGAFRETKSACKNEDPDCARECVEKKQDCKNAIEENLENCVDGCSAAFEPIRDACKVTCKDELSGAGEEGEFRPGSGKEFSRCFFDCVDDGFKENVECKAECKLDFKQDENIDEAFDACSDAYKACVTDCKIVPEATPTPGA